VVVTTHWEAAISSPKYKYFLNRHLELENTGSKVLVQKSIKAGKLAASSTDQLFDQDLEDARAILGHILHLPNHPIRGLEDDVNRMTERIGKIEQQMKGLKDKKEISKLEEEARNLKLNRARIQDDILGIFLHGVLKRN
jgi:hypothetical protein